MNQGGGIPPPYPYKTLSQRGESVHDRFYHTSVVVIACGPFRSYASPFYHGLVSWIGSVDFSIHLDPGCHEKRRCSATVESKIWP